MREPRKPRTKKRSPPQGSVAPNKPMAPTVLPGPGCSPARGRSRFDRRPPRTKRIAVSSSFAQSGSLDPVVAPVRLADSPNEANAQTQRAPAKKQSSPTQGPLAPNKPMAPTTTTTMPLRNISMVVRDPCPAVHTVRVVNRDIRIRVADFQDAGSFVAHSVTSRGAWLGRRSSAFCPVRSDFWETRLVPLGSELRV